MRSRNKHRNNTFHASYPSTDCGPANMPSEDVKLGNYGKLEQLIGIGTKKLILPQSLNYVHDQTLK